MGRTIRETKREEKDVQEENDDLRHAVKQLIYENSVLKEGLAALHARFDEEISALRDALKFSKKSQRLRPGLRFYVATFLIAVCTGLYIGYAGLFFTSSTKSPASIHDAPWNDFARIVCETASAKWQDVGDRLGHDWQALEGMRESGRGSEMNCRSVLEKYKDEKGDSEKCAVT
ncbi:uncharacterized protein [Oscarella lobularis]|uniref:uncharacterized protein isoform X2 n=1 Tax=Oscarella lobularis TaxID=121494 RepID=UPI0033144E68